MKRAALIAALTVLTTATAWAGIIYNVPYIDADGTAQTASEAEVVTTSMGGTSTYNFSSSNGWYYVNSDVTLDGAYNTSFITLNIILGDGATLTISRQFRFGYTSVNIYCQSGGTGRLVVNGSYNGDLFYIGSNHTLTINGGIVEVTNRNYGNAFSGNLVMNGGTASFNDKNGSYAIYGTVTLNGGTFTATSNDYASEGICSSYVTIADGKYFKDGSGNIYYGSLSNAQKNALNGKTLSPATQTEYIQACLGTGNDGSASKPYTISDAAGWDAFCDALQDDDTWNRFSGKTVVLDKDIEVTRMAGSQYRDFCGTFDGQGNTLTVNISSDDITDENPYVAPFRYAENCTIQNLHVTGTITTDEQYTGGLIGGCWGTVIVENCRVSTAITSTISGDGTHGGIVGIQENGSLYIRGCVFDGQLLGATTYAVGGFVGWRRKGAEIRNSLFAPTAVTIQNTSCATFARNKIDTYNCYYTYYLCDGTNYVPAYVGGTETPNLWRNGKATRTITAATDVTIEAVALTGDTTQYDVSGITAYSDGGLQRGETLYYGSGDEVSLSLSNTATGAPQGYRYDGYTASAGTLDGTTLTMPDQDVTISVNTAALRSDGQQHEISYVDANGVSQTAQAIALDGTETKLAAGTYFVGTDITFDHKLTLTGNVTLILFDCCTMNIGTSESPINGDGIWADTLEIFGQTNGSGAFSFFGCNNNGITGIYATDAITINGGYVTVKAEGYNAFAIESCDDITINGGNVNVTATGEDSNAICAYSNVTINGGMVTATASANGIRIYDDNGIIALNGGIVNVTGDDTRIYGFAINADNFGIGGTIILDWTNLTDRITANSYGGNVKVADGKAFSDGTNCYGMYPDGSDLAGKTLQPAVAYYDAAGKRQCCTDFTLLTGNETELTTAGWYVAAGTLNYDHTLTLSADVNLILTDGCQMNFGTSENRLDSYGIDYTGYPTFTIYNQFLSWSPGTLSVYTTGDRIHGIRAYELFVNGGNIVANANGDDACGIWFWSYLTVNGGNVTATATGTDAVAINGEYGTISINGGSVIATGNGEGAKAGYFDTDFHANGGTFVANGILLVGQFTEFNGGIITASSYDCGSIVIADGILYTDGTDYYGGELTDDEIRAIAGKTLSPSSEKGILYIGQNGKKQYCTDYTVIEDDTRELTAGEWYVVDGNVFIEDYTGFNIIGDGAANIILCDGATLYYYSNYDACINGSLNIYGQSEGTGVFDGCGMGYNKTDIVMNGNLTIYGGEVTIQGNDLYEDDENEEYNSCCQMGIQGDVIMYGGTLTVYGGNDYSSMGNVSIIGNVTIYGGSLMAQGGNGTTGIMGSNVRFYGGSLTANGIEANVTLDWTSTTDFFFTSSYWGAVTVADGKVFTDGEGGIYTGTLTDDEIDAIASKTLQPALSLADTQSNGIEQYNRQTFAAVALAARTIDTDWNTLAVPFNVSAAQLTETFGNGVKVYELTGSSLEDGVLGLEFTSATSIKAGKPYFIAAASANVVNPVFKDVTIQASANNETVTNYVDFIPTLGVTTIEGENPWEVLVLGASNTLYNPASLPAKMKAFRGYFTVHDYSSTPKALQFRMTFDASEDVTGIIEIKNEELKMNNDSDAVYNLMGQKVKSTAPNQIQIIKGKKVIRRP